MDSVNSGCSVQSSSGGDEEFDSCSRGETAISSFFDNSSNTFGSISSTPQQQTQFLTQHNPNFFDTLHNNDLIWSRGLASHDHQQNYNTNIGNITASSSPSVTLPAQPDGHASRASTGSDRLSAVVKNPKKRSRASRRAPTTVLATDTTNFRQMVQEFTGIPDAPFRGSPYSRRLDLFSAAVRSGGHFNSLDPLYPIRPTTHKVLSPFSSSPTPPSLSTMIDSIVPTTNLVSNNNNTITAAARGVGASTSNNNSNNYQLPTNDHHLLNLQQHQNNININPLQLGGHASMSLGNLSGFPSQETQSGTARVGDNDGGLRRWTSGETVRNNDGVEENLVSFDGSNNVSTSDAQHTSGYNLNVSEKGVENTVADWGR